jgi:hypothetical protein
MKEFNKISPSKIYSYYECPFRISFEKEQNFNSNTRLGIVLHKMYELAIKGKVEDFEVVFKREVAREEKEEPKIDLITAYDFLVKKIKMKKIIENISYKSPINGSAKNNMPPEITLEDNEKHIIGRVDFIKESDGEIEIIDFKTGVILNDNGEIKKEYEWQLKLYAYLYDQTYGKFPTKLSLEDMCSKKYYIKFDVKDCEEIYKKAKELFHLINENNIELLAQPSEEKCKNCYNRKKCDRKFQ